jgi:hypothetical protein
MSSDDRILLVFVLVGTIVLVGIIALWELVQ